MADLLVVDDDLDMAGTLADVLQREGHRVRLARDGIEGLAQVEEAFPELILCDVEMPVLTGPDMAYRLLVRDAGADKIPILLISGARDLPKIAERVGTSYFLAKPLGLEDLRAVISRALTERAPPHPHL